MIETTNGNTNSRPSPLDNTTAQGLIITILSIAIGILLVAIQSLALDSVGKQQSIFFFVIGGVIALLVAEFLRRWQWVRIFVSSVGVACVICIAILQYSLIQGAAPDTTGETAVITPSMVVQELDSTALEDVVEMALAEDRLSLDNLAQHLTLTQLPIVFNSRNPASVFGGDSWVLQPSTETGQIMWTYSGNPFELNIPNEYFCAYWSTVGEAAPTGSGIGPSQIANVTGATMFFRPMAYSPQQCR